MKVLIIHNSYRERGGEDVVVELEERLLRDRGHDVIVYHRSNEEIIDAGLGDRLGVPVRMTWSRPVARDIESLIQMHRPDLAHVHNTHYRISLAAVTACARNGLPVVMTLHNYRLLCPAATLFRNGAVCEECLGRSFALPGVIHGCWRGSASQTGLVAIASAVHRELGTLDRVARFIAPSEFVRQKHVEAGFDPTRIVTKPHFLFDRPSVPGRAPRDHFMYVGRLSDEKGVDVLLESWLGLAGIPLRIIGEGPLTERVIAFVTSNPHLSIEVMGRRDHHEVLRSLDTTRALIHPSTCYETFGMTVLEAMSRATPAIVSSHGAAADLVEDGRSGIHVEPGNSGDLAAAVRHLWEDPSAASALGARSREVFDMGYTANAAHERLMDVYAEAIAAQRH